MEIIKLPFHHVGHEETAAVIGYFVAGAGAGAGACGCAGAAGIVAGAFAAGAAPGTAGAGMVWPAGAGTSDMTLLEGL
jgi:hypothetical protein